MWKTGSSQVKVQTEKDQDKGFEEKGNKLVHQKNGIRTNNKIVVTRVLHWIVIIYWFSMVIHT